MRLQYQQNMLWHGAQYVSDMIPHIVDSNSYINFFYSLLPLGLAFLCKKKPPCDNFISITWKYIGGLGSTAQVEMPNLICFPSIKLLIRIKFRSQVDFPGMRMHRQTTN